MTIPRTGQVPRELAARYGEEAHQIIREGRYTLVPGRPVMIEPQLQASIRGTVTYPPGTRPAPWAGTPVRTSIAVSNTTTLSAARRLLDAGRNPVALNFASASHPGGGWLAGARAQEESLAWSSGLVAALEGNEMYAYHKRQPDPLHADYVIYTPAVPVFRGDDGALLPEPWPLAFLTAAAPLRTHLPSRRHAEVAPAMRLRIAKVLGAGLAHGHDAIVLGAWGCGAYGNDGEEIAALFREALEGEYRDAYHEVEFAVLDWSDDRQFIGPFERAFGA